MSCHVMSCHVMSCHVMSCYVMSCHVIWCHVIWCDVMWCDMMWCDMIIWYDVMWCNMMWCDVMWCGGEMRSGLIDSALKEPSLWSMVYGLWSIYDHGRVSKKREIWWWCISYHTITACEMSEVDWLIDSVLKEPSLWSMAAGIKEPGGSIVTVTTYCTYCTKKFDTNTVQIIEDSLYLTASIVY